MFNRQVSKIEKRLIAYNSSAEKKAEDLRSRELSLVDMHAEHDRLKHKYPYFGLVNAKIGEEEIMLFSANDDVVAWNIFWTGHYEREITDLFLQICKFHKQGMFLDIGAYTGYYSLIAAAHNFDVTAFEIMARTAERLNLNVKLNMPSSKIDILNFGCSDKEGLVDVYLPRPENFLGTGNAIDEKSFVQTKAVRSEQVMKLDDWWGKAAEPNIKFAKIDVEGHEANAIRGGLAMIRKCFPDLIVEISSADILSEIKEMLPEYSHYKIRGMNYLLSINIDNFVRNKE